MKIRQQSLLSYRLEVALRCITAIVGGYLLAAASNIFLALYLPLAPSEAVIVSNMLCLVIFTVSICWVFAVNRTWQAVLGMSISIVLLFLLNLLRQRGVW